MKCPLQNHTSKNKFQTSDKKKKKKKKLKILKKKKKKKEYETSWDEKFRKISHTSQKGKYAIGKCYTIYVKSCCSRISSKYLTGIKPL